MSLRGTAARAAFPDLPALRVNKDLRASRDLRVNKDLRASRALRANKDLRANKALRASPENVQGIFLLHL